MATVEARGIHRRRDFTITESLIARLARGTSKGESDECWPWTAAMRNGYGAIKHETRVLSAHVVAFRVHKGEIPEGMIVTHSCDNRTCCNPNHLFAGTAKSNADEMQERRKLAAVRGAECYNAVLNAQIVRQIHALMIVRGISYRRIARMLGQAEYTVRAVTSGKSWKHVPKPTLREAEAIVLELPNMI